MMIKPKLMTVDELYAETDSDPTMAIDMEYRDKLYRARIFRPLNEVNFDLINSIYGGKCKAISVSGYRMDESGNRLDDNGRIMFNDDDKYIDPEDEEELERRFYGSLTMLWFAPKSADMDRVHIDWSHPGLII
ncbi:hypothetical protein [Levilactobacillus tujiorum]|uniref:hypothetical protein n=1 Tax=Levilactobacillus tujiorum TaxID=2912243 RepID=UPI0014577694|nr:hypothetical protein [Levilactobacillus tujiorum]NLR32835.1 hypothetical protein [Levilactobacillus tujiorum]